MKSRSLLDTLDQIPDRLFPHLQEKSVALYVLWREVCHLAGSLGAIGISHLFFLTLHPFAPLVVGFALVFWITYQEFFLHARKYHQPRWKGVLDWFVWILPFSFYLLTLYQ